MSDINDIIENDDDKELKQVMFDRRAELLTSEAGNVKFWQLYVSNMHVNIERQFGEMGSVFISQFLKAFLDEWAKQKRVN